MSIRPSEAGAIAGVESATLGLLVFLAGSLLIVNAWAVVDAKLAVEAAAREGTRAYVEAPTAAAAHVAARVSIDDALDGHGQGREVATITLPTEFRRCVTAEVSVRTTVQLIAIPFLPDDRRSISVMGHHAEVVDPYRNGLATNQGVGCAQ